MQKREKGNSIRIAIICFLPICILLCCFSVVFLSAMGLINVVYTGDGESIDMMISAENNSFPIMGIDEALLPPETSVLPETTVLPDESQNTQMSDVTDNPPVIENPDKHNGTRVLCQTEPAKSEYFCDTLFVGDSRMVGLSLSSQELGATFYASVGLSVHQLETKKISDGKSAIELMQTDPKKYGKIYMMFGLNELGWPYASTFIKKYREAIEKINAIYPDAEICIMSIMPVSEKAKIKSFTPETANARIIEYNNLLLGLAEEVGAWYLQSYELFADERGFLDPDLSPDGIHLRANGNKQLLDYITNHKITDNKREEINFGAENK